MQKNSEKQPTGHVVEANPLLTKTLTPESMALICDRIVDAVHPEKIILFGSTARGNAMPGSDLDLLVVMPTGSNKRHAVLKIQDALYPRRFGLDLLVQTAEEVQRRIEDGDPFYLYHLMRDGQVLYERATSQETRGNASGLVKPGR